MKLQYVCIPDFELQGCTYLFAISRKYLVTIAACRTLNIYKKKSIGFLYEPHKCDILFISFWFVVLKVVKRIPDDTGHFSIHKCEKKNANQHDFRFHLSFHARCKPLHSNMSVMGKIISGLKELRRRVCRRRLSPRFWEISERP